MQLVASGTAYTSTDLGVQAGQRLPAALQDSAKAEEARPDTGAGLRACLTALGIPSSTPIRADVATLDGSPAVIAVVQSDTGQTVYAVAPECDATHPRVLAGPVPSALTARRGRPGGPGNIEGLPSVAVTGTVCSGAPPSRPQGAVTA